MNTSINKKGMKLGTLSILMAAALSAHASITPLNFSDSGSIPQGGTTLAFEQTVSSVPDTSIISFILTLNFNQGTTSLTGDNSGIQGNLVLGTSVSSPFVTFNPVNNNGSGLNTSYQVTFSGTSGSPGTGFSGLNPNDTWGLVLWDNSTSGIQNYLTDWSLSITAVPEPVTPALAVFGGLAGLGLCVGALRKKFAKAAQPQE